MSNYWDNNLKAFEMKYKDEINGMIESLNGEHAIFSESEEVENKKVLYAIKDNKQYQLDFMYDSDGILDKWYTYMKDTSLKRTYILFGIGNGMYVKKLLKEIKKTDCNYEIIVYEPDTSILKTSFKEFDFTELIMDDNTTIYINGVSKKTFKDILHDKVTFSSKGGMHWNEYMNYSKLYTEDEKIFYDTVQVVINSINATRLVQERFGKSYYKNTLSNIDKLIHSKSLLSLYNNLPKDIPAIIVSAGPSLSKNIKYLKEAKNKCFMIAADSAVPALLEEGISPDIYACVDGRKNPKHFVDERVKDIPALVMLFSAPAALKDKQTHFFISDDNLHIKEFMDSEKIWYNFLSSGGSVANIGYSLAVLLGIKDIILVGQDLAYTDGKTHAANTVRENSAINRETLAYVKDINGNIVESSNEFILYKTWFEDQITKNKDIRLIDATEGGAYIEGTELMTLKDAILKYCVNDVDISEAISKTEDLLDDNQKDKFRRYLANLPSELDEIKFLAKKSKKNYEEMKKMSMLGKLSGSSMRRLFSENTEIGDRIDHSPAMTYVEYLIQDSIHEVLGNAYNIKENSRDEIMEASNIGIEYANSVINNIDIILEDLKQLKVE